MSTESVLEEFVAIVEAGSVSAAARALELPRASLSRRLAQLEAHYGVQLLHRETRRQVLTEAGTALYSRARRIVADLADARQAVRALDGVPRGVLRVGLPPAPGIEIPLAKAFLTRYPEVELEFVASHTHDDLLSAGIDVALRGGEVQDESLIARTLVRFRNLVYAAPAHLERHGVPTVETIGEHPCLLGFDAAGRPETRWPLWDGGSVAVSGRMRSNTVQSRIEGARQGLGLVLASERYVRPLVRAGELIGVLEDEVGSTAAATLVWRPSRFLDPKIRAFVDVAVEVIGQMVRARDVADGVARPPEP